LHRAVALEAIYDSADSFPQPRCHFETRKAMLWGLWRWATGADPAESKSIFWLHGPAGAGKSAIMQTLCHRLQDADRLGASFFFKRGHPTRGNGKVLFATLAYQLALHIRSLKASISQAAEDDPSVVGRFLDIQLHNLIVEPCQILNRDFAPPIVLIDGLDECEDQDIQQEILRSIANAIRRHPVPLKIFIASRPEPHIRDTFEACVRGLYDAHNINQSFADIEIYLRDEFSRIHREHHETMGDVQNPWPSSDVLQKLVFKSSGYFIYAATVIKFIDDRDFRPSERLDTIVHNLPSDSDHPLHALDKLYTYILSSVPKRSLLLDILCVIANFTSLPLTPGRIEDVLGLKSGDVRLAVRRLHSILQVPSRDSEPISCHHASFHDFLVDPIRSGEFCIHTQPQRIKLARAILKAYQKSHPCVPCSFLFGLG
ncbi:hypothetical protein B0H13DRAFT_1633171, partial [Mycena leptocephala]